MAALTKPLFPLAGSVETAFTARFLDRIGKGIRGAPRDALIADVAPAKIRGACFGLRQAMDTVGAVLGPLLAMVLLYLYDDNLKAVLWFAVAPAALTVILIIAGIQESKPNIGQARFRSPFRFNSLSRFKITYWRIVVIGAIFTLARFSEAFLILKAQQSGLSFTLVPLVMVVMSLFYALSAYPAGALSDLINKNHVLSVRLILLILADLVLAQAKMPFPMRGVLDFLLKEREYSLIVAICRQALRELQGMSEGLGKISVLLFSFDGRVLWYGDGKGKREGIC